MSTYKIEKNLKGLKELAAEFKIIEDERNEPDKCGGLFYRVVRDAWRGSDNDINFRYRFRPLKSKSCTGCWTCDWILDDFHERLSDFNDGDVDYHFEDYLTHGMFVQLKVTHVSTDWETGVVDDYEIDFVEVKE